MKPSSSRHPVARFCFRLQAALAPALAIVLSCSMVGQAAQPDILKYLPDGAGLVLSVHFQEVCDSAVYQELRKDLPDFRAGESSFETETGVAPANLARVTLTGDANRKSEGPFVVLETRNPVSGAAIRDARKPQSWQKNLKFEEVKVGEATIYDPTFQFSWDNNPDAKAVHGEAFVVIDKNVVLMCRSVKRLREVLERGKPAELTANARAAWKQIDASRTIVMVLDAKTMFGEPDTLKAFEREFGPALGGSAGFVKMTEYMTFEASLTGSTAEGRAALLCKDAETASDAKKIFDGAQVVLRGLVQGSLRAPKDIAASVDALKFTAEGDTLKAAGSVNVESVVKWARAEYEHARQQAVERERSLPKVERKPLDADAPARDK